MKTAIVHDWLVTDAGAEKVLKELLQLYPESELFSLVEFLNPSDRENVLGGKKVHTSFLQKFPFAKTRFRNYLPLFPRAIESFDLSGYDLVISSSWAVAKGVKTTKNQKHICYCYSPIRYAWDLYDEYTGDLPQPKKYLVQKTLQFIRRWDVQTLSRVDDFIACSDFVADRIKRTYHKDSTVIYPPVDVESFVCRFQKENFYLTASRLVGYKKVKLIVEAFNRMPEKKLVVIGSGEQLPVIKKIAKSNITVLGYQPKSILIDYMQRAKGFVYAAVEDFGIVPIEANACGTPVIALNQGATAQTIRHGINGLHFAKQSTGSIAKALEQFEKMRFDPAVVSHTAHRYNKKRFQEEIGSFIHQKMEGCKYE